MKPSWLFDSSMRHVAFLNHLFIIHYQWSECIHNSDIIDMAISDIKRETEYMQDIIKIFRNRKIRLNSSDVYINSILLLDGDLYYIISSFSHLDQIYSTKSWFIIFQWSYGLLHSWFLNAHLRLETMMPMDAIPNLSVFSVSQTSSSSPDLYPYKQRLDPEQIQLFADWLKVV